MIIKLSSQIFHYLVFTAIILSSTSLTITHAATVTTLKSTKNSVSPRYFQQQEMKYKHQIVIDSYNTQLSEKKTALPPVKKAVNKTISLNDSLPSTQIVQNISEPIKPATLPLNTKTDNAYTLLKQIGQGFLDIHQENVFLQEALVTFDDTKKLFNQTESTLNALSQEISLSLELDYRIQVDLLIARHSTTVNTQPNSALPGYRKQSSIFHYQENITAAELQDTLPINNLVKKILRISTLFYLSAVFILISILKWIINIFLTKKYKSRKTSYM